MRKNKYGATAFLAGVLLLSLNACSGNGAEEIADVEQQAGASRVTLIEATINVSETNTLQMQLEATLGENAVKVQKLVLTGEMRAVDMCYIRDSLNDLQELDMSAVTIKESRSGGYGVPDNYILGYMLEGKSDLRSLQFPSSIVSIGYAACRSCTSLQSISIPSAVTSIEREVFCGCSQLSTVNFEGNNVTSVDISAFDGCAALTDYAQFATVQSIGLYAFRDCGFTTLDLSNVTTIGQASFGGCSSLTSVTFSNRLISVDAFAFENTLLTTLTIPSSVTTVNSRFLSGCNKLISLFWESTASVPDEYFPNCFLYLTSQNGVVAAFGPNWKNVVIDGMAESIEFDFRQDGENTPPFHCPQAFTAKKISFTRDFNNWQNTVIGASSGWYTITLPFTPTSITHPEKGELAPFGSGVEGAKPFWLRQLKEEGFVDVTTIEPNVPYILSLPYDPWIYADEYNIKGKVTFSAENVQIPVTPDALPASDGPTFQLCPTYQYVPMRGNVYALNTDYWVDGYNFGSVFVRSAKEVYPFEAYAVVPSSAAPAVLSLDFRSANSRAAGVRNTTGIPQIGDK